MDAMKKIVENLEHLRSADICSLENFGKGAGNPAGKSIFFRVERISSDKDFPHEQALEHVFSLFRASDSSMIYYIRSDGQHLDCHMGVRTSGACSDARLEARADMLAGALRGNFRGSRLSAPQEGANVCNLLSRPGLRFSTIQGIPSRAVRMEDREFQSVDHVIHAMNGKPFHIVIVWQAVDSKLLEDMEGKLLRIYGELMPLAGESAAHSEQESDVPQGNSKKSTSTGKSVTQNRCNKELQAWLKALDDELLPRMRQGKASGMFLTSVYLGAETEEALALLETSFTSVFQSDSPSVAPLFARRLPLHPATGQAIARAEIFSDLPTGASWLALRSRQLNNGKTSAATCLTAREISIIAGFPHGDIPGMEVSRRVSFGLNMPEQKDMQPDKILLGKLLRDGDALDIPVELPPSDLDRHMFIAGTTGAGKTTTCHRLLKGFDKGFLVIEPAKTEYRTLLRDPSMRHLYIFTAGNESAVPFRLNPFEFLPSESISAHIDMLKACFMASFDMEAAIPNLLEEAMYRLYEKFGWDISDNSNRFLRAKTKNAWSEEEMGVWFPTINDYIMMVIDVVREKRFGERLESEYIGSIRGRLESLTVGVKGRMLNTRRSIDFDWLLDQKVVIELEDLKSGEDKAFVMALIIGRLLEAIKARYRDASRRSSFRHILLIEEAHRLLSRPDFGDSPGRRLGVDMLTDMLAEVRKYHEGLIIVDQIPSKLASEVLKNTNTKIIHRLFAEEDKRTIGDAIALSGEQRDFLSQLDVGEAVLSGNGWRKPVHVRIEPVGDTAKEIDDERAFENGKDFWKERYRLFCPASPAGEKAPSPNTIRTMCDLTQRLHGLLNQGISLDFKVWQEVCTRAGRLVGGNEFLKNAIFTCLFVRNLLHNRSMDFDPDESRNTVRELARKLLSGNEKAFREVRNLL